MPRARLQGRKEETRKKGRRERTTPYKGQMFAIRKPRKRS